MDETVRLAETTSCPCRTIATDRRKLLGTVIGLGAGLAGAPSPAWSDPQRERLQTGDVLVRVTGEPVLPDDLQLGGPPIQAWPMDPETGTVRKGTRLNKLLLLRLDLAGFSVKTKAVAADGIIAYSAICTHTGCDVTDWHEDTQILQCPCHLSQFDPKQEARVVGGPAPRKLPALPLKVENGRLVAAGMFQGRVGFQQT